MKYSIQRLISDVMARLGEIARPQSQFPSEIPWPDDIIGLKVRAILGEMGGRLIREADEGVKGLWGNGVKESEVYEVRMREMPCGLYGAEVRLPEGFLRLGSVKMAGWRRSVSEVFGPDSAEWSRQWSGEAGIAGSPERPRAYLDSDGEGVLLRLMGSESEDDTLEFLAGWCVPEADDEGVFEFPAGLYAELVGAIAGKI